MTTYRQTMSTALESVRIIQEGLVLERQLSDTETKRREDIAQDLPDSEFKDRYGARWKEVKMAVATKQAKNESLHPKEEISEAGGFSPSMINKLKKAYSTLNRVDPTSPAGKKMPALLDKMDKEQLIQIVKADIKFLSLLAINRLIRDHGMRADAIRKLREDREDFKFKKEEIEFAKNKGIIEEVDLDEANVTKFSDDVLKSRLKQQRDLLKTRGDSPATQSEIKRLEKEMKNRGLKEELELDEFTKKDFDSNEDQNMHTENAVELARKFGSKKEYDQMVAIYKAHRKKGEISRSDQMKRDALVKKYISKLKEEVELDEAPKYDLYHKDFSSAMQHAYKMAKKLHGITIDPEEIDSKVATGPKKPSSGKTNKYRLKGDKGAVQIQVYNMDNKKYELNMYKEEVIKEGSKARQLKDKKKEMMVKSKTSGVKVIDKSDWPIYKKKGYLQVENSESDLMNAVIEQLAKIKGNSPADKGRKAAVEDDIERAEKKGDKKEVEKLKEAELDEWTVSDVEIAMKKKYGKVDKEAIEKLKKVQHMGNVDRNALVKVGHGKLNVESVEIDEAPWDSSKTHSPNKQTANVKKLRDKKKNQTVFKGTPAQIKQQMKDWKKKHDKVKIGEGYQVYAKSPTAKSGWIPQGQSHKTEAEAKKDAKNFHGTTKVVKEEVELDEGKMSQLHQHIKDKKSPEEIAKIMKLDVKTIKSLMSSYNFPPNESYEIGTDEYRKYLEDLTPMEGARSDAMRAMKKDKDFNKKDTADDDDHASASDRKAASKNVFSQLLKSVDAPSGKAEIVFKDKKKVKVSAAIAKQVIKKSQSFRRPKEKLEFQSKIQTSYRDLLKALKEDTNKPLTILDRIDAKIKEKKNG